MLEHHHLAIDGDPPIRAVRFADQDPKQGVVDHVGADEVAPARSSDVDGVEFSSGSGGLVGVDGSCVCAIEFGEGGGPFLQNRLQFC